MPEYTKVYRRDELLDMPIRKIVDGWVLRNGKLYLLIETERGHISTIEIKRRR